METRIISNQNQMVTVSIPITYELKFKPDISMMKSKAVKYDMLINSFSRSHYGGSEIVDRLFGTATSMVSQAGMSGVVTVAPIVVGAVLANTGIIFDTNAMVNSLPTGPKIGDMDIQNVADTVILAKVSIKMNPFVFISCDKGNKKGINRE